MTWEMAVGGFTFWALIAPFMWWFFLASAGWCDGGVGPVQAHVDWLTARRRAALRRLIFGQGPSGLVLLGTMPLPPSRPLAPKPTVPAPALRPPAPQPAVQPLTNPDFRRNLGLVALYRVRDADGRLLYVGISQNPWLRFTQHAGEKSWWRSTAVQVSVEWYPNREVAAYAERIAIKTEDPLHNMTMNPKYVAPMRTVARSAAPNEVPS